jgi:hypothetical protein
LDKRQIALEQGLKERTVVVEYASLENSGAYAEALKALGNGAVRRLSDC